VFKNPLTDPSENAILAKNTILYDRGVTMLRHTTGTDRGSRWLRIVGAALGLALIVSCTPAPSGPVVPPPPTDIVDMNDVQLDTALAELAPRVIKGFQDPKVRASIPKDQEAHVNQVLSQLGTKEGRAALGQELRETSKDVNRYIAPRPETVFGSEIGEAASQFLSDKTDGRIIGDRSPAPTTVDGATEPVPSGPGACGAPLGTIAPPNVPSGALLTPQHDVFTVGSENTLVVGQAGPITAAGSEPIVGQGSGIELRTVSVLGRQQMKVRIHLQDPKGFGPTAVYPIIRTRAIGADVGQETRSTIVEGTVKCYAGDTNASRGYFEGWIPVPQDQPGFQVIVEVVENEWYFSRGFGQPNFDVALAQPGPQYFAGADRATIHVGAGVVTSAASIPHSVGAFATSAPDPAAGVPNVLTETNGEFSDDIEGAVQRLFNTTVNNKVNSALAGDIVNIYLAKVQAWPTKPIDKALDLKFVEPSNGFGANTGEPAGATGALQANGTVGVSLGLYVRVLAIPCHGITARINATVKANVWADSGGDDTSIALKLRRNVSVDANFDMPTIDWIDPACILAWGVGPPVAEDQIEDAITAGLDGALGFSFNSACLNDGSLFRPDGTLIHPDDALPDRCLVPGTVQKIMSGFDLNDFLPTISLGGAAIKPVINDLDNAWCTAPGAPAGCTSDQNLIGRNGVEVVADAQMLGSLADAFLQPFGGRFRNVFAPKLQTTTETLTVNHRDPAGGMAGLGVIVDPRQINLILRHLAQGGTSTRTTNGLLDVSNVALPVAGTSLSVRPEVAPLVLGVPDPGPVIGNGSGSGGNGYPSRPLAAVAVPDLRVGLVTAPNTAPIEFSIATRVNAGAGYDATTGKLKPILDRPNLDIQVVSGCQANYLSAYAASYALCGRGTGGSGSPTSLTDLIDYVANDLVLPLLIKSIGGIAMPNLDGIVPGFSAALSNVRFAQRGGYLAVYANLRPIPKASIAISENQSTEVPSLRFFPVLTNIDVSRPTTYTWEITDVKTGLPVATAPIVGAELSAVRAPLNAFVDTPNSAGTEFGKAARAKLTVRQANLEVVAIGDYTWYPPTPPQQNPCPGASARLVAPAPQAAPGC